MSLGTNKASNIFTLFQHIIICLSKTKVYMRFTGRERTVYPLPPVVFSELPPPGSACQSWLPVDHGLATARHLGAKGINN